MKQIDQKTLPWMIALAASVVIIAVLATLVFTNNANSPGKADCSDAMEFMIDLNYDDINFTAYPKVDPEEAIQKGFRIKNTGTCTWTNAYYIDYVYGNTPSSRMQGLPTTIKGKVEPGQSYDLYINLIAPKTSGKYIGYWQMFNGDNESFGQPFWVAVQVRSGQSQTPSATVTGGPAITSTHLPTEFIPTATAFPNPTETDPSPTATATPEPGETAETP